MKFKTYYYRTDLVGNYWEIPLYIYSRGETFIVVDPLKRKMQVIEIEDIDDEDYKKVYVEVIPELYTLSDYESRLLERFHYSWFNVLYDYLISDVFKRTINSTIQERKITEVFPEPTQIFSAFLTDFYKIKCVWLGLSPYYTKQENRNHANGYCFSTFNKEKPPSLQILEKGIKADMKYGFSWTLQNDLLHLSNQGVLLLNSALTTTNDVYAHVPLWKEFIQTVISKLNVPVIAFGKVAQSFTFNSPIVHKVYHPSFFVRKQIEPDYKCFSELNEILNIQY